MSHIETFKIIDPSRPDAGEVISDEVSWPQFEALGWVKVGDEPKDAAPKKPKKGKPSVDEKPDGAGDQNEVGDEPKDPQ